MANAADQNRSRVPSPSIHLPVEDVIARTDIICRTAHAKLIGMIAEVLRVIAAFAIATNFICECATEVSLL